MGKARDGNSPEFAHQRKFGTKDSVRRSLNDKKSPKSRIKSKSRQNISDKAEKIEDLLLLEEEEKERERLNYLRSPIRMDIYLSQEFQPHEVLSLFICLLTSPI